MLETKLSVLLTLFLLLTACGSNSEQSDLEHSKQSSTFTIAMIPDTQNYVDFTKQKVEGFAIDASELFIEQMQYIADNSVVNGGEIAFVASVGDVWQHQSLDVDAAHAERGVGATANPFLRRLVYPSEKTKSVEIPKAIEGYKLIANAGLPFGVAPGNHDHDAMWTAQRFPPNLKKPISELRNNPKDLGVLHVGGLDNFRSVFGNSSEFFSGKLWYVDSFNGGANSAQIFTAGGYRFLHITLEMQASNAVVAWAKSVMKKNAGLPTIFTTHDYLNVAGERQANPIVDLSRADPEHHNSAQQMWQKLYGAHDQILMVLCGHQHGQSHRVDANMNGKPVIQILADYQDRGQVGLDAGQPVSQLTRRASGLGDGWFRLMEFDLNQMSPKVVIKTYSSHYKQYSTDTPRYAQWYKKHEHPALSDEKFHAMDHYQLNLIDFHQRFATAKVEAET